MNILDKELELMLENLKVTIEKFLKKPPTKPREIAWCPKCGHCGVMTNWLDGSEFIFEYNLPCKHGPVRMREVIDE